MNLERFVFLQASTCYQDSLTYVRNKISHWNSLMCKEIARCQTQQEIEALRRMGRPIAEVREMSDEEAVVCSLTGSPSDFNEDV